MQHTTVAVIGGGVVGACLLRELARAGVPATLLEAGDDVATGASRANSSICHAGFDPHPGTAMARHNVDGCAMMPGVCRELGVPFVANGALVLAFGQADMPALEELLARGRVNGVPGLEIIGQERLRRMEPNVAPEATAALYAPTSGLVCPYELAIAATENAMTNGAGVLLNFRVTGAQKANNRWTLTAADGRQITAAHVVNTAGAGAGVVAEMLGEEPFATTLRIGEYILCDKTALCVTRTLFQLPTAAGKGVLVTPTPDGNLLLGPTSRELSPTQAAGAPTGRLGLDQVVREARKTLPNLPLSAAITTFAGVRSVFADGDFRLWRSQKTNAVHAAGIGSPGLTAAPSLALELIDLLREGGLQTPGNPTFNPVRPHQKRFAQMTSEERLALAPDEAAVVCRCEMVTRAEVLRTLDSPLPPRSVDAVKRRTRAGMGRCQGGFCCSRIMEILAQHQNKALQNITKDGPGSPIMEGVIGHG